MGQELNRKTELLNKKVEAVRKTATWLHARERKVTKLASLLRGSASSSNGGRGGVSHHGILYYYFSNNQIILSFEFYHIHYYLNVCY